MPADKQMLLDWLSGLAGAIVTDADDSADLSARLGGAPALDAAAFAAEVFFVVRVIGESADAPEDFERIGAASGFSGESLSAWRILAALGLCIAGPRIGWPSRPAARAARARIAEAGTLALSEVSALGGAGADLYAWLQGVVAVSCRYVSDAAASAAPIVRIETGISLPSTVLAYQLYGDASRAAGLVAVASSATPLVMPTAFEALKG